MAISLKPTHLEIIIEILQLVVDYKKAALRKSSWNTFYDSYLISIVDQIRDNEFKLNNPKSNSLTWLIDQICWSHKIIEGVDLKNGIPLIDTKLGQQAVEILRAASRGQEHYDTYFNGSQFDNIFDRP